MSAYEAVSIIVRARRERVTLFAKADGKLGWKGAQRPSDALLAVMKEHREEILALLPLPASASFAIGPAKATVTRLQALGFRAYLDHGALLIADATGRRRDVSRYLPIKEVFDRLNAGLDEDSGLLDPYTDPEQRDDPGQPEARAEATTASGVVSVSAAEQVPAASSSPARSAANPDSSCSTFYEFFAGGGMAREGLGSGWRCVFANDNDREKAASYAANFGRAGLVVRDVARLSTADLPGHAALAWASPPCQDLSLAGDRAGLEGDRSGAFWPFMKLMQGLRSEGRAPRLMVIENVVGLLTSHDGKDFAAICDALADAGYRFGAVVIDAMAFVPQSRVRVFIVAVDKYMNVPGGVVGGDGQAARAIVAAHGKLSPNAQAIWLWWRLPEPPVRNTVFADVLEDTPQGVSWHTQAETDRLLAMMSPANIAKVEAARRAGKQMVGGLYRRIRPDGAGGKLQRAEVRFDDIAGCLRVPTGGSSRQTIMIIEAASTRSRLLSPREAARLKGLDDGYKLPADYNEGYGLVGDGVAVPVVRFLAQNILEPLLAQALTIELVPIV
jgi:DNA (cytosine-5)-methyltransferase 1